MTRIWWVRHGPTHSKAMNGWTDVGVDLSATAQLARLAAYLPADAPVVSSDLHRARATADAIQGARPRLPDMRALREVHFGDWEGQDFGEVWERWPREAEALWDRPGDAKPPNGESWNDLRARVDPAVDRLAADHPGDLIAVAHFGAILSQVQRATGETAKQSFGHKITYLSVTRIALGATPALEQLNHTP